MHQSVLRKDTKADRAVPPAKPRPEDRNDPYEIGRIAARWLWRACTKEKR